MQLDLTPEQETQISQLARVRGVDPEQLVIAAASYLVDEDTRFREAVQRGLDAAERGDYVKDAHVWSNVETILTR